MNKKRVFVGVSAFLMVFAMNLWHAWNNYGITADSWILKVMATEEQRTDMYECKDTLGNTKMCNSRESETPTLVICDFYFTYVTRYKITKQDRIGTADEYIPIAWEEERPVRYGSYDDRGTVSYDPDDDVVYATASDYCKGTLVDKYDETKTKYEFVTITKHISTSEKECVHNSGSSCTQINNGLDTACKAAYEAEYKNGAS